MDTAPMAGLTRLERLEAADATRKLLDRGIAVHGGRRALRGALGSVVARPQAGGDRVRRGVARDAGRDALDTSGRHHATGGRTERDEVRLVRHGGACGRRGGLAGGELDGRVSRAFPER